MVVVRVLCRTGGHACHNCHDGSEPHVKYVNSNIKTFTTQDLVLIPKHHDPPVNHIYCKCCDPVASGWLNLLPQTSDGLPQQP